MDAAFENISWRWFSGCDPVTHLREIVQETPPGDSFQMQLPEASLEDSFRKSSMETT
jgi:hypothetical protein